MKTEKSQKMAMSIITLPKDEKVLRLTCARTSKAEVEKLRLIQILRDSMARAWTGGVGLSAIQVGIPLAFAYMKINGKEKFLMNPKVLETSDPMRVPDEGCLSIPNSRCTTSRFRKIHVYNDWDKTTKIITGFEAIVIQHEMDHMDGILNIDRTSKIGRNEPCVCNSGKKFKKCCGR